jgi:myo-inositol catabolism protein IolC
VTDLLWTLAFDHRNSLRRSFFGITGEATEAVHQRARDAKAIIFDGVVAAIEQGIPAGQPAVLVDEEYGADVIARARELGVPTAVPVEASGHAVLRFEHGDDGFGPALEKVDPTYAKVLVRYNPDGDPDDNRGQRERLALLQRWVSDHGRQWMLELLVPATPAQTNQCGGDIDVYDANVRPELTVRATAELAESGLTPELWKLEGMATSGEYAAIAAACRADGNRSGCLVLGRGADEEAVDRWLSLAAPVPGFVGFAVGRTLWWNPLRDATGGTCTAGEAAARIAANYRRLIGVYLDARQGGDRSGGLT